MNTSAPVHEQTVMNLAEEYQAAELQLYRSMRNYWLAAAYSSEVTNSPARATVMEEQIVLVRLGSQVRAFQDICPHRGTALSLGRIEGNVLRCAYHGWTYGSDGKCTSIPSRPNAIIPKSACLKPYLAAEHAGIIWVCLGGTPRFPLPEFPQFDDPGYRVLQIDKYDWNCSAQRRMENYVDFGHFAWVHDGYLADSQFPEVPEHRIFREGAELRFEYPELVEPVNQTKKDLGEDGSGTLNTKLNYRLFMPYSVLLEQDLLDTGNQYALFFTTSPIGPDTCRSFTFMARDYSFDDETDKEFLDFNTLIIEQDKPIIESLRPEMAPVNLADEIQIRVVDQVSVEYRKWMKELVEPAASIKTREPMA